MRCHLGSPPGSGAANTVVGWREQDKAAVAAGKSPRAGHRVGCSEPAKCASALDRVSALIEDASDRGSFGLAQSTSEGKALVRILVLAAVTTKHGPEALQPHGAPGRSWLAWAADAARDQHPLVAAVTTKSWPAYKASLAE